MMMMMMMTKRWREGSDKISDQNNFDRIVSFPDIAKIKQAKEYFFGRIIGVSYSLLNFFEFFIAKLLHLIGICQTFSDNFLVFELKVFQFAISISQKQTHTSISVSVSCCFRLSLLIFLVSRRVANRYITRNELINRISIQSKRIILPWYPYSDLPINVDWYSHNIDFLVQSFCNNRPKMENSKVWNSYSIAKQKKKELNFIFTPINADCNVWSQRFWIRTSLPSVEQVLTIKWVN